MVHLETHIANNLLKNTLGLLLGALLLIQGELLAQQSIEVSGALGASLVNKTEWAGQEPTDFSPAMGGFMAQVYLLQKDRIQFGAEFGYRSLFWFDINPGYTRGRLPIAGTSTTVDATHLMATTRYNFSEDFFMEFGFGAYSFDGFTDLAIAAGAGYKIPLSNRFFIPVKVRFDRIFNSVTTVYPVGATVGLGYAFSMN